MSTPTQTDTQDAEQSPRKSKPWCGFRRALRVVQWMVNLTVVGGILLVFTPAGDWAIDALIHVDPLERSDYIVVLGGGKERAVEAARLYRDGWAKKVIVTSSGDGAEQLGRTVEMYGVPHGDILIDRDATCTADHPRTVASLNGVEAGEDSFIIVTSMCHTFRARRCFKKHGYRKVCMRAPDWILQGQRYPPTHDWTGRAMHLPAALYEYAAWAYNALRGRV